MIGPPPDYTLIRRSVLLGALSGPMAALFILVPLGGNAAVATCVVLGLLGLIWGIHTKYRSKFGVSQTWIGSLAVFILFCVVLGGGGVASSVIILSGESKLVPLAVGIYAVTMLGIIALGVLRELRALAGPDSWARGHLDLKRFIVRRHAPGTLRGSSGGFTMLMLLLPIALNIPLFIELGGGRGYWALYFAIPGLTWSIAMIVLKQVAPAIPRALYARRLERKAGRTFVHEEYEAIQELRRTFWLSRWLMRDDQAPTPPKHHADNRRDSRGT